MQKLNSRAAKYMSISYMVLLILQTQSQHILLTILYHQIFVKGLSIGYRYRVG